MLLTVGSLFSGIGGLELGLELAGDFETLYQIERDPYALAVLSRHWPNARRFNDIRSTRAEDLPTVDVLVGGFPCQPHSVAGSRNASEDDRDLWPEFARIIRDTRPRWVLAENVPGLLSSRDPAFQRNVPGGFFGRILRNLAELGFDAEWHCLSAAAIGAPHIRNRVFLLAYADRPGEQQSKGNQQRGGRRSRDSGSPNDHVRPDAFDHWATEPGLGRMADGIPDRMDRIRCLGNAVVPQQAAVFGRAIIDAEHHFDRFGSMPDRIVRSEHLKP